VHKLSREMQQRGQQCWNYKVIRSQRNYLEGLIDDRDDADDKY